jgi:2-polyprenyl-3-methyl-5-hydroxy-6-metoxy-1,4-benzoquinol methylase
MMQDEGGYDHGYEAVPCFWGTKPGSLVAHFIAQHSAEGLRVLDVGAGEGKNAAAFASKGAQVDAVECSALAIRNGRAAFANLPINWVLSRVEEFCLEPECYDVVVSYGLIHCLRDEEIAKNVMERTKAALKRDGFYIRRLSP